MKTAMTFEEVLDSEFKYLVESLEHGSSDPDIINWLKSELKEKTGYIYHI